MAKLQSASIRLVQKMNRKNRLGEFPIYVVVCFHGRLEKATSVSCLPRYWDSKREQIKVGCPNAAVLNKMLSDVKGRIISRKNEYELRGCSYTPSMLMEESVIDFNAASKNDFSSLASELIEERRLKHKTSHKYHYAYDKLCEFKGRRNIVVDEITLPFVKDFSRWLTVSDGTKRDIFSAIASVWNYAISKNVVDRSGYPFDEFKFTSKFKSGERDYFLDSSHIVMLKEYFLDLVCVREGGMWHYRDGALERLHKRSSKEFGILWFLLMYKLNGSAPIEIGYLRCESCRRMSIGGEDYWAIDFKRRKTSTDVHVRWKRDMFCIIALEHFMGFSSNGYVYPIINSEKFDGDDVKMQRAVNKASESAIKHVREAFKEINDRIIRENVEKGLERPLIECEKVVMYTARHTFASNYLSMPNASISGLASLLARSPNTIATYIHQLTHDADIASEVDGMPI